MKHGLVLVVAALAAFSFNLILTPYIIRLSHKHKWYDTPDKRKIHKGLIPRLGGVGIFLSVITIAAASSIALALIGEISFFQTRYLTVLIGLTAIFGMGLFDDFRNLKALLKLVIQILAAAIVTTGGFTIRALPLPYIGTIQLGIFAYPVTILWIVGITNAINLVDGMDGLAGGISVFAAFSMAVVALIQGEALTALLALILFGSIAGFLVYNFPPARIFMGDSGSLLLGFSLSVIPLMDISKTASVGALIIPITLLTIPIIDTISAIIRRISQGRSIASPDKEHIHHKLLDLGLSERKILALLYGFSIYLSIVAITSVILPKETNVYFIIIVWIGSLLGYGFLNFFKEKKSISKKQKDRDSVAS